MLTDDFNQLLKQMKCYIYRKITIQFQSAIEPLKKPHIGKNPDWSRIDLSRPLPSWDASDALFQQVGSKCSDESPHEKERSLT